MSETRLPGGGAGSRASFESAFPNETALTAFAFTRGALALIIIVSVLTSGIEEVTANRELTTVVFLLVAAIGLLSAIRDLFLRYNNRPNYTQRPWAAVLLDSALAIGVMAVIDAEASPLAWIALIAPVLETAILFSMLEAGIVWLGLSLAFLALRLSTGLEGEPAAETLTLAVQQVLAVVLVSGPAALLSDSTQQRIEKLASARKEADQVADRLRRVAQAASEMSQENSVDSVLDSVSRGAVMLGFDHADVVLKATDGTLVSHGSHATGPFRLPPIGVLVNKTNSKSIATITAGDDEYSQMLHSHDLSSGHAVQIGSSSESTAILRVWSRRFASTDQDLKALSILAGHAREIHKAATLLAAAQSHSDQLLHEVRHDGLTGLANRSYVLDSLEERIAEGAKTAIFFLDLDGFKEINDTLGHRAGDVALVHVADRLREIQRPNTLVGRMGGDEFIIILPLTIFDTLGGLERYGARVAEAIRTPFTAEGVKTRLGSSIGLAVLSKDLDADQLISLADHAMYEAKRAGADLRVSHDAANILQQVAEAS